MITVDEMSTRAQRLLTTEENRVAHNYHPLDVVVATGSGALLTDVDGVLTDGGVYYGLYADRDAMPDADVLGRGVVDALQELLDAPRPRGRRP